jgi:hypothetical protein
VGSTANPLALDRVLPFRYTNLHDTKFARIGARLKVVERPSGRSRTASAISNVAFLA